MSLIHLEGATILEHRVKKAAFATLLLIGGAYVGFIAALYLTQPTRSIECGDACVGQTLMSAVRWGVGAGLLAAIVGVLMSNRRQAHRTGA